MNWRFNIGQSVRALDTCQGMEKGTEYTVVGQNIFHTPFGSYVTYALTGETGFPVLHINNGHLLLTDIGIEDASDWCSWHESYDNCRVNNEEELEEDDCKICGKAQSNCVCE